MQIASLSVRMHAWGNHRSIGRAFTIMEVMVAVALIATGMGSIMMLNSHAIRTLRATMQASASSQVLQQRIEQVRARQWPEISSAPALVALLGSPTESEKEMTDSSMVETLTVTVPSATENGPVESAQSFSVRRSGGTASTASIADFSSSPSLLLEGTITWRDTNGFHRRTLRTLICRAGLTRSGIYGSPLGRAGGPISGS